MLVILFFIFSKDNKGDISSKGGANIASATGIHFTLGIKSCSGFMKHSNILIHLA